MICLRNKKCTYLFTTGKQKFISISMCIQEKLKTALQIQVTLFDSL